MILEQRSLYLVLGTLYFVLFNIHGRVNVHTFDRMYTLEPFHVHT